VLVLKWNICFLRPYCRNFMFMAKAWYYVSELRPPTGLLFIPRVIPEHWEPWWNDIDGRQLLIRPSERCLAVPPAEPSSSISEGTWQRRWWIWPLKLCFTCRKILLLQADSFTSPSKLGVLYIFMDLKYPSPWPGFNPRTLSTIASMLTITSLRGLCRNLELGNVFPAYCIVLRTPKNVA
jgi:hypothetical protein